MAINRVDLREKVPVNIVKGANLERTINDLFNNFEAGEKRNAELVNKFFDQTYFRGEESLINKLISVKPDVKFDDIKDEGINLALLTNPDWMWEFNDCISKIGNNELKKAFMNEVFDKVQSKIGTGAPYADFSTKCAVPGDTNILGYLQTVVDYLNGKEGVSNGKKTIDILKGIEIKNENLNSRLSANQIPTGVELSNSTVPVSTKNDFDKLLSFEIGKEADRTISISREISGKLNGLFSNTFPAVNTIISEDEELKYDESKLGDEYQTRAQAVNDDANLTDDEKESQLNDLKREYYLKYLKTKNAKIGNALQQLYDNNFDYSKLESNVLKDYIDKVVDSRVRMLFDNGINEVIKVNFGNLDEFKTFCKNLADPTKTNISLNDVNLITPGGTSMGNVSIPIQKSIVEGENSRLKSIDQFGGQEKSYDALPIRYEIDKSHIDALNITMEDKTKLLNFLARFDQGDKYVIEGKDIGMLIYLFFVINNRYPITNFKSDDQEKIQNLFGEAKDRRESNEGGENGENGNSPDGNNEGEGNEEGNEEGDEEGNNEGNEGYTPEKFKEEIEKKGSGAKFENGAEIWLPVGNSEIPGGGYQWMKIKITDINMNEGTFKGKVFGGELEFKKDIEGKTKEIKMNKEFFDDLANLSKDSNKIRLLPDPGKSDFNTFRNGLNNKLGTSNFTFPPEGTTRTGNKFMQRIVDEDGKEKEVQVKYFTAPSDDKSIYKIEYNPIRRNFRVLSTFNGDEKGKDGKSEKKRFSYKRDMDWNNFLIFLNQKGLVPQTEEEANHTIARQDQEFKMVNGGHWTLNRFSFNNIKGGLKDIFGTIKKKMDEYNKSQTDKFKSIVESPILNALSKLPLSASMKYAISERQQEIYNERDNAVWKKIEGYLKVFQADPDFGTTFENIPPHIKTQGGKSLQMIVTDRVAHATDRMGDPGIYQAAALLLANIEKGGSPYRGLAGEENSGLWVRALLGKAHYEQFMRDKQKCINDLKSAGSEKAQIQDVLATCEMDYIINNVSGANGKLKYFGSHEDRGIPGKEGTNYIDNPSKRILSNQFADKLKGAYKGRFNKSSVEEAYGKISHNDFNLAKEDFKRLIKSSRFPGALGNLKKMFLLASNDEQKAEYQKCFLVYMLSGILDFNGKKDLRKQTYLWAKTMGFLPGMLAKNTGHSEQVVALLNDFCESKGYGNFSDSVKSYFRESDLKRGKVKIGELIGELDGWWTVDKMRDFEKYSKSKFPTKSFPKESTLDKLQKSALDTGMENMDNSLLDNPLVANSGGLLSNANVVRDRMAIRDGGFDGKDPDERENRAKFWSQIATDVNNMDVSKVQNVSLLLRQYCNWFGLSDGEETYKWIKTAYYRKDYIGREITYKDGLGHEDSMGKIGEKEIDSIIWYTFKGKVMSGRFRGTRLPKEMNEALDAFQKKFQEAFENDILKDDGIISEIFNVGNKENVGVLGLGSRSSYNVNVTGRENSDSDDDTKAKNRIKRNFTSGNFINYYIANIEKSFRNLPSNDYMNVTTNTVDDLLTRFTAT